MAPTALARHAGPIAVAGGAAFALVDLARWVVQRPADFTGMMADPAFRVANGAYFVAFIGLAIALVALHERFAPRFGRYGLIAFLVAFARTMTPGRQHVVRRLRRAVDREVAPQAIAAEEDDHTAGRGAVGLRAVRPRLGDVRHRPDAGSRRSGRGGVGRGRRGRARVQSGLPALRHPDRPGPSPRWASALLRSTARPRQRPSV
jgi:hypothetical protein